jgi:hypothetical protein
LDVRGLGEKGSVVLDGADRGVAPGPTFNDALASGGTDPIAECFVIEGDREHGGKGFAVTRRNDKGGFVVGADDLGESPAGRCH